VKLFSPGFVILITAIMLLFITVSTTASFAQMSNPLPRINIDWGENEDSPKEVAKSLQILVLFTVLSLAPAILIAMTSFTRIVIILSFLRHALGTQQIPPNQILLSFALFLTILTMMPVIKVVNDNAIKPYMEEKITQQQAFREAEKPIRTFMFKHTRHKDLELFIYASDTPRPQTPADVPTMVLIPSFLLSELKTAFAMGFALFISFLVVDMVVASVLMSIGMFMLPPMMISLPLKVMLFVLVDGWYLVVRSIINSFR
jgi:flagellar biosynthesis protein FliP